MSLKDKFDVWYEDVKDKVYFTFHRDKLEKDQLYETRWVWYHTVLVVELAIIILLLLYIGFAI
ncbi:hypothetical protein [uncultured Mediterranean phage]|nr:hypothetical protein [uncultured Mediterranean phage]MQG06165.1 hypothetical protein [SAR202 cluster bacterium]|tara:strand:+ start:221 stop:409 length:189 start_codon:yes stop_codon:yes gene_type:complete